MMGMQDLYAGLRADDTVRLRLDGGGTLSVTVDELVPDRLGFGAWAYDRSGRCFWLDTEDGHAYHAEDAARIKGHAGRFKV